ncbi:MAG: hypothetical protein ACOYK9_05985 [Chlamydiia bacterium]
MSFSTVKLCGSTLDLWQEGFGHKKFLYEGRPIDSLQELPRGIVKLGKIGQDWRYDGINGLTHVSCRDWQELTPTHQHEPLGKYLVCLKTKQRHTYLELIDSKGQGYSVGLSGPITYPFSGATGRLFSPDPYEVKKLEGRVTKIEISEKKFFAIKGDIEKINKVEGVYFNVSKYNCSRFALNLLRDHLGLDIDNREFPSQVVTRMVLQKLSIKPSPIILKILDAIGRFFRLALIGVVGFVYVCTGVWYNAKNIRTLKDRAMRVELNSEKAKNWRKKWVDIIQADFAKMCSTEKIKVWQDMVAKRYRGKETVRLSQAKRICLPKSGIAVSH